MYWFSCLNNHNQELYLRYMKMYLVAVTTAKETNSEIRPILVFDGSHDKYIELLESYGVQIYYHRSNFYDDLVSKYNNDTTCLGAFLRIDIPYICEKLNIDSEFVLYTDTDVYFYSDVSDLFNYKPNLFLVAGEFDKYPISNQFNSGVMWINWKNMLKVYYPFLDFIKSKIPNFPAYDQGALREFFSSQFEVLDYRYNYKPYWGEDSEIKILHYHGPKPTDNPETETSGLIKSLIKPFYLETRNKFITKLSEIYLKNTNTFT